MKKVFVYMSLFLFIPGTLFASNKIPISFLKSAHSSLRSSIVPNYTNSLNSNLNFLPRVSETTFKRNFISMRDFFNYRAKKSDEHKKSIDDDICIERKEVFFNKKISDLSSEKLMNSFLVVSENDLKDVIEVNYLLNALSSEAIKNNRTIHLTFEFNNKGSDFLKMNIQFKKEDFTFSDIHELRSFSEYSKSYSKDIELNEISSLVKIKKSDYTYFDRYSFTTFDFIEGSLLEEIDYFPANKLQQIAVVSSPHFDVSSYLLMLELLSYRGHQLIKVIHQNEFKLLYLTSSSKKFDQDFHDICKLIEATNELD